LRSIRADEPLEAATTGSLEALRLMTQAIDARESGEPARAQALLEEALRVDLATTDAITVVESSSVSEILSMMGRQEDVPVRGSVAEEVALRGGYRAIIEGEVGSAGSGYVLLASIRSASTGQTIATFRRTAADGGEVIAAIDGLSQDIRERAGESLRSIRADEPLEAATTGSLEALRLMTQAIDARESGEPARAQALLEEALRLDPDFAMAWRWLAIVLQETGNDQAAIRQASTRAYELRERLTDRERYRAIAQYHNDVTFDLDAEIDAYQTLLDIYPDDATGLNNLSIAYSTQTRWEEASELLRRAISGPGTSHSAYTNLGMYETFAGNFDAAQDVLAEREARYPGSDLWRNWAGFLHAFSSWDSDEAQVRARALQGLPDSPTYRRTGTRALALTYAIDGEFAASAEVFEGARMEARRDGAPGDVIQAWVDEARAMDLLAGEDQRPFLEDLLASGVIDEIEPGLRPNFRLIPRLGWVGLTSEADRLLQEWKDAAGELQSVFIQDVEDVLEAVTTGLDDPTAGAQGLERKRRDWDCERCYAWEIGTLYERAGDVDAAIRERERSLEAGQDFYFALHRLAAHEALGRLYEAQGDTEQALEHYRAFAGQLIGGDDTPKLRNALARINALGGRQPVR
ncbi:MAG: tetratricopeptide repeat protein, partial [Gemmatimonadetes bacterium]|nr:tetratricopeptide repeat protein [Gemmatimonadota bacterium]